MKRLRRSSLGLKSRRVGFPVTMMIPIVSDLGHNEGLVLDPVKFVSRKNVLCRRTYFRPDAPPDGEVVLGVVERESTAHRFALLHSSALCLRF